MWNAWRKLNKTWAIGLGALTIAIVSVGLYFWHISNLPVDYTDIREHFKYGSIGSEPVSGIPYWIWKVLPVMFPENCRAKAMPPSASWSSRPRRHLSDFRSVPSTLTALALIAQFATPELTGKRRVVIRLPFWGCQQTIWTCRAI